MKFEHVWTGNWKNAFRGLRHPMESYDKSDSKFGIAPVDWLGDIQQIVEQKYINSWEKYHGELSVPDKHEIFEFLDENSGLDYDPMQECYDYAFIGPADMDLAQRMIRAGSPNDKFLRQIFVSVDITAPLYWWKEMDTYKVATVANSTSTMHKLASTPITLDCFETDDYNSDIAYPEDPSMPTPLGIIQYCERLRQIYLETKDIRYWKELIRWLPESWLQTRAWSANYAVLRQIIHWRKGHRLKYEWDSFIKWCQSLPYSQELLFYANGYENEYKLHDLLSPKCD